MSYLKTLLVDCTVEQLGYLPVAWAETDLITSSCLPSTFILGNTEKWLGEIIN